MPRDEDDRTSSYQERWEKVRRQRKHREWQQRQEQARMDQEQGSASSTGAENLKSIFAEGDKVVIGWTSSPANYDDLRIQDQHTAEDVVQILAAALTRMKDERDRAISIISTLMRERTRARAYMATQTCPGDQPNLLYKRVGLDEQCPNHVLIAARKSFRRALHPDSHPPHERPVAERLYKETEAIFDQLYATRRL